MTFSSMAPTVDLALELVVTLQAGATMADDNYLVVSVSSSSGDSDTVHIRESICREADPGSGNPFICNAVLVEFNAGFALAGVQPKLDGLRAQPVLSFASGASEWASLRLFTFPLDSALAGLRALSEVASADRVYVLLTPNGSSPSRLSGIVGTRPWLGGRQLLVSPGDTVTARYRQPDGSEMETTAVVR